MASLAKLMRTLDAKIFAKLGEVAILNGVEVKGVFNNRYREIELADTTIVGLQKSFDCQYNDAVAALTEGDSIEIFGDGASMGTHRFMRRIPPAGDESGKVILELGTA